jgi:ADP-ribosylglycohydrolase
LFAGAIGDAIGAAFERKAASSEFRVSARQRVTDDRQLTLATCESLIEPRR